MKKLIVVCAIATCFAGYVYAGNAGLMAYWDFDEGSGTVVKDKSGNSINGNIQNVEWTKEGKYGGALKFTGEGFVDFGNVLGMGLDSFTIMAWVNQDEPAEQSKKILKGYSKPVPVTTTGLVFAKCKHVNKCYFGYGLFNSIPTQPYHFVLNDDDSGINYKLLTRSSATPLKKWIHLTIVIDREQGQLQCYVNGTCCKQLNITSVDGSIDNEKAVFTLGYMYYGGVRYFTKAVVDDMAFFDRALKTDEVKKYYEAGKPLSSVLGIK